MMDNTETDTQNTTEQEEPERKLAPEEVAEKWEHVPLTPEQQMRFNRLYAQVKRNEKVTQQLIEDNRKLIARLTELEAGSAEKDVAQALVALRQARVAAFEAGDFAKINEIDDQIDELKQKQREVKTEREKLKQPPKEVEEELPEETRQRIIEWAQETDEQGELKRPFVDPAHKDHKKFMRLLEFVLTDPENDGKSEDELFAAVEQAIELHGLGKKPKPKIAAVLPVSDSRPSRADTPLTPEQRYVARRLFPNSKDPEAEYRKALKDAGK